MNLKISYFQAIYNAKNVHKNLYDLTINSKKVVVDGVNISLPKDTMQVVSSKNRWYFYAVALALYKKVKKKTDIPVWKQLEQDDTLNKAINKITREHEIDSKLNILRIFDFKKPFFVCSSHGDSALEHKPYQAKVFIDERALKDKKIKKYCESKGIKTMQWVTGSPVYLITRPNCRHYFVRYRFKDIVNGSYTIPYRTIGDREFGSPRKSMYEQKLKELKAMYRLKKTDELRMRIDKVKFLIKRNA